MQQINELIELSKILKAFGNFRQNLPKEHNDFVATQLLKTYEVVTKTYVLQGKEYTGTFKEDVKRKYNKVAYEKEAKLATVLASFGFDVTLIEENNSLPGKKPDAIVNGIVMDFKEIKAFSEKEIGKNTLGGQYQNAMRKQNVQGVAFFLHNFSNQFVKKNMVDKTSTGKNGFALFFHENTGFLQLIDIKKIRTAHIEQSKKAGHPKRLPNNLRRSKFSKDTSINPNSAICNQTISHSSQKSSKRKKYKTNKNGYERHI